MVPYFVQPSLTLGPLTIHTFGVLVVLGIIVMVSIVMWRSRQEGLPSDIMSRLFNSILLSGLVGAHLMDRFISFPESTLQDPLSILRIWSGLSCFGGFLGASTAAWLFIRRT